MSSDKTMLLNIENNVAVIEASQINILFQEQREEFKSCVEQVIKNPAVHVALLMFRDMPSNYIDIQDIEKIHGREKWERLLDEVHDLLYLIENSHVSWVAAIQGACIGYHLELALSCDYRIADYNDTIFGFPETSLGLIPGFGGCIRLPQIIGLKKSLEMVVDNQFIDTEEAYRFRLLHEIAHPLDLKNHALLMAEKINKGHTIPKPIKKYKPVRLLDRCFEVPFMRQLLYYREKRKLMSKTKGFYPASLEALEVIKKTYPVQILKTALLKTALKEESNTFCDLVVSSTTRNLMSLYINREEINIEDAYTNKFLKKVAVIGAGTMGASTTCWFADHQIHVLLKDIHAPSLSSALKNIHLQWDKKAKSPSEALNVFKDIFKKEDNSLYKHRKDLKIDSVLLYNPLNNLEKNRRVKTLQMNAFERKIRSLKIRPQRDYSGFQNVDLVIENVIEDLEIKKKVITETASHLSDKCVFATNTSSFSVTELAKSHPDPERFLGVHFFHPVEETPLVEVIKAEKSSTSCVNTVFYWLKKLGKVPVIVKDSPGFLVQRLFLPLMSEALWLLKDGVSVHQVDQIYSSFGFSMGPFRLMDELGLDICMKLVKLVQKKGMSLEVPEEFFNLRPIFLGKKNKKGFYIYNDDLEPIAFNNLVYQDLKFKTFPKGVSKEESLNKGLYRMVDEALKILEEQVVSTAEELDIALVLGMGFPAFRGGLIKYTDDINIETVVKGLEKFSTDKGDRYRPSSALLKQKGKFY